MLENTISYNNNTTTQQQQHNNNNTKMSTKHQKMSEKIVDKTYGSLLLDAIKTNSLAYIEYILKQYPDKKFYPSLESVTVHSYNAIKIIKKYYDTYFDVNMYNHIFSIADTIEDPLVMREFAMLLLDEMDFNVEEGYGWDNLTYFYRNVCEQGLNIIIATEVLKNDAVNSYWLNSGPFDHYSIGYMIKVWEPSADNLKYYLEFTKECLKKGLLFNSGTTFKNKQIEEIVKKYPKKETMVIEYNC